MLITGETREQAMRRIAEECSWANGPVGIYLPEDPEGAIAEDELARRRLAELGSLMRDVEALQPRRTAGFTAGFDSFEQYEEWKRAQTDPWLG